MEQNTDIRLNLKKKENLTIQHHIHPFRKQTARLSSCKTCEHVKKHVKKVEHSDLK